MSICVRGYSIIFNCSSMTCFTILMMINIFVIIKILIKTVIIFKYFEKYTKIVTVKDLHIFYSLEETSLVQYTNMQLDIYT